MKTRHRHYHQIFVFFLVFYTQNLQANVVGTDTQNFNPITNGLDFVTVHSSETLKPCVLNCGVFLNYAVNSLPNFVDQTSGSRTDFVDSLISSDINVGVGLIPNWDVGMSVATVHSQSVDTDIPGGAFEDTGLTEIRLNTKYRFMGNDSQGIAVVASANFNQIDNNPFIGDGAGPTFNLELAADTTFSRIAFAGNIGYRFRNPGDPIAGFPIQPVGNQIIASVAASYLMGEYDTKVIGEIFTSFDADDIENATDRDLSSAELLLGVKSDLRHDIAGHLGVGTEIYHGSGSPDWRIYAGVNFAFGPLELCESKKIVRIEDNVILDEDPFARDPQPTETFLAKDVLFAFNSSNLREDSMSYLVKLVAHLNKPPIFKKMVIEGHTDSVGSAKYNITLSKRRAQVVKELLVKKVGIPANKVVIEGFGESRPIADNGNFQGRALNRRVEFQVTR